MKGWAEPVVRGVEDALGPVDAARRALYRLLAPVLAPWLAHREVRVALTATATVLVSLAGAALAPLVVLALGPLLLGVPHLVADVRYLVARPALHLRPLAWVVGALVVASAFFGLVPGFLAAALAALLARGPLARRALVAAPWLLAAGAAWGAIELVAPAVAQLHNLVAVLIWLLLAAALNPGAPAARAVPALLVLAGAAPIATGALDPVLDLTLGLRLPGATSLRGHGASVAPFADPTWMRRGVVLFAYLQSVHYGLWLRVVPEEARPRPSTRSWLASFRALRSDLGDPLLALALGMSTFFALWGALELGAAREGYLRLAMFHGPLEFAALSVLLVEGREAWRPCPG